MFFTGFVKQPDFFATEPLGFLFFFDPPKPDISKTIESMEQLGISLKIITGDNKFVAASIS
jgi:P-type Mg2+ transporter